MLIRIFFLVLLRGIRDQSLSAHFSYTQYKKDYLEDSYVLQPITFPCCNIIKLQVRVPVGMSVRP
jgi:hypothetical protein